MNLPYFFSLLQQPDRMMGALVDLLVAQDIKSIAILYMDDLFGLENFAALNNALKKTKIQVVERKSYPLGVKDLSPVLRTIKDRTRTRSSASPIRPIPSSRRASRRRSASIPGSSMRRSAPPSSSIAT